MPKYHPDTRFISDFAAGSLPVSQALCVSAHLHYCNECKAKVAQLTDLGAELFNDLEPINMEKGFSDLMSRIKSLPENESQASRPVSKSSKESVLPSALLKLTNNDLESLDWYAIGKHFRYTDLNVNDLTRETSLLNIKAGGNVPKHRHKGDEITVVLKGSFSDQDDHYQVGDFIVRTQGETHEPVAAQDEDCLCLSTLDAPIQMTNWLYRLLVPFMRPSASALR
jgi:putative transcriptional regulator